MLPESPPVNWGERLAQREAQRYAGKAGQFGLVSTVTLCEDTEFSGYAPDLMNIGVWSIQNPYPFIEAVNSGRGYNVVVGFKPPIGEFHIGHLTAARELAWHCAHGGVPKVVIAGVEGGADKIHRSGANRFFEMVQRYDGTLDLSQAEIIVDTQSEELRQLRREGQRVTNIRTLKRIYGWDDQTDLRQVTVPPTLAAAFLFPAYRGEMVPTVVMADVNQAAHTAFTREVARKLKLEPPTFTFRSLVPSLKGPEHRMSIHDGKSVLFVDDSSLKEKIGGAFSGGKSSKADGSRPSGDLEGCSVFSVASVVLPQASSTEIAEACQHGANCALCKTRVIDEIEKKWAHGNNGS